MSIDIFVVVAFNVDWREEKHVPVCVSRAESGDGCIVRSQSIRPPSPPRYRQESALKRAGLTFRCDLIV